MLVRRLALVAAVSVFAIGGSSANNTYYDSVRTTCLFSTTTLTCTSCHTTTTPTPTCVGYISMTAAGRTFCDSGKQPCSLCADNDGDGSKVSNGACGTTDCNDNDARIAPGKPELCDNLNNDCNSSTADGTGESWYNAPCDGSDSDLCNEGNSRCTSGARTCTDTTGASLDLCNGNTNDDCNTATADGSGESWYNQPCDGSDSDLCNEGNSLCTSGARTCSDTTGASLDLCNGNTNDDCNTATADGSGESWYNQPCDGSDGDLCVEGTWTCTSAVKACTDTTTSTVDLCNGLDDDCNGATADGSAEAWYGSPCDGADSDLCVEGTNTCTGGAQSCTDTSSSSGDLCNGLDDDCDTSSADGSEDPAIGQACDGADSDLCLEGTNGCVAGTLQCSDQTSSTGDLCNGLDDDCNSATGDGSGEPWFGQPCDGADGDLCAEGTRTCSSGAELCTDATGTTPDTCNGLDDDCDSASADGSEDPAIAQPCDGADSDRCLEGTNACVAGALQCSDQTSSTGDLCNGLDDDCNAATGDGSGEPWFGQPCDGADGDLCAEGTRTCSSGAELCTDATGSTADLCNGLDDDCDAASADGSEDPASGQACDGADSDLCLEGTNACVAGALQCSDQTSSTVDLCNGLDDDCNASTADGAAEPTVGQPCDGTDSDLCPDGVEVCQSGAVVCNDPPETGVDRCNGTDDDCNASTADGSGEPWFGQPCDGADTDLCIEGSWACTAGVQTCTDTTGSTSDPCNGTDDDCDPSTADGSGDPTVGQPCDGTDGDLCTEGTRVCSSGAVTCSDTTGTMADLCNGLDDDCDPTSADGSEDPAIGPACDGPDGDLCPEGMMTCVVGTSACSDASATTAEVCNGLDDDCNPSTADGADEPTIGQVCDGADLDSCNDGIFVCLNASLGCNDDASAGVELCNGADDDCDASTADGSGEPWIGQPCDGPDGDACLEGSSACSGGERTCTDLTSTAPDLCNGLDDDCAPATPDGAAESWLGAPCDGADSDLCLEGAQQCVAGRQTCGDGTTDTLESREVAGSCADHVDNDCDGVADQLDPGCNSLLGTDVISIPASAFAPVVSDGVNGGLRLDGVNDFVAIGGNAALSFTRFALEAYVFLDDATSSRGVIVSGGTVDLSYSLEIDGSPTAPALSFRVHGASGSDYRVSTPPSLTIPIARWMHVAVTVDPPDVALWIDGTVVATADDAPSIGPDGTAGLRFGRGAGTGTAARFFRGELDEIRVFNSAATDVDDHAGRVIDPSTAGLIGYWRFDESTGTGTVRDATTWHIDGTLGGSGATGPDDPTRVVPAAPLEGYPSDIATCVGALSGTGTFAAPIAIDGGSRLRSVALVVAGGDRPGSTSVTLNDLDAGEAPAEAGGLPSLSTYSVSVASAGASSTVETLVSTPQDHAIEPDQNGMVALLSANPDHAVYGIRIGFDFPPATGAQDLTVVAATLAPLETAIDGKQAPLVDATDFEGYASSASSGSSSRLVGPLHLPDGSRVLELSMSAWDADATADAVGEVHEVAASTGVDRVIASVSTSSSDPSVRLFESVPSGTVSIDNELHYYYLQVVAPRGINAAVVRIRHSGPAVAAPDRSILAAAGLTARPIPPAEAPRRVVGGGLRLDDGGYAKVPIVLPSGAIVSELRLDARATASVPRATLYRYRPPASDVGFCPDAEPIATVEASSGDGTQVARSSASVSSAAPIANREYFYEVVISDSPTAGQSDVVGVQVLYAGDADHDGVLNREDNCAEVSNSNQSDVDTDGIGDPCDSCFDRDDDGFGDPGVPTNVCPVDNCPGATNATQADGDGDAVGDACDACPTVSDPQQQNRDNDGFGDACETGHQLADVDLSGRVDGFDLAALARAHGAVIGDPRYDPRADLNRDDQVDGQDLALLAPQFGK